MIAGATRLLRVLRALAEVPDPGRAPASMGAWLDDVIRIVRTGLDLDLVSLSVAGAEGQVVERAQTRQGPLDGAAAAQEVIGRDGLRSLATALGRDHEQGWLITACRRPDFPDEEEREFIQVAAHQLAAALRTSRGANVEDRFEAVADSVPAMLWVTDAGGACTFLSRAWYEFTGQSSAAGLQFGWLEAVHPEDRDHARHVFEAAQQRKDQFWNDYRVRRADGSYGWALAGGRPHFAGDSFLGYVGIVMDITDRKRAEGALRRTEQTSRFLANVSVALSDMSEYRAALRKLASLAVPFFADWCAVDVAGADGLLERLVVAHTRPDLAQLGHDIARRWPARADDRFGPAHVLRTGQPEMMDDPQEWLLVEGGDPERHRALRELGFESFICVPIRVREQTLATATFGIGDETRRYRPADLRVAEDLAHRVAVAIANADLYHAALEADRRKDEFLATLSHELRTPLNAIVGWSHVLRDGTGSPETVRKAAETIHRNAQVQAQLISDILDVSRIVAGKVRLDLRPVNLSSVIEAALDTVRPAAQARGVRVEVVLDPAAGPISGDAERLQQVIWNLLSNAIKFVPEKDGRVHVRLEAVNSHVRLTVEDNGPGIEPRFLPFVFERFRQEDASSTRRHQGLGLGLAIVRHLVELHGGTVAADNRAERTGAIFTVELPRRSVAVDAVTIQRHPHAEEPAWLEDAPALAGVKVVVIDDQPDARELVKAVLERCGASVTAVGSAREGLEAVRGERPHVVLADVEMPGESGYDFVRQLRELPASQGGQTPAAALTAYATAQDRMNALRAGFQIHIPKPVQPAELAAVVASLFRTPRG
jgi:PAS domain S-box-containing protein